MSNFNISSFSTKLWWGTLFGFKLYVDENENLRFSWLNKSDEARSKVYPKLGELFKATVNNKIEELKDCQTTKVAKEKFDSFLKTINSFKENEDWYHKVITRRKITDEGRGDLIILETKIEEIFAQFSNRIHQADRYHQEAHSSSESHYWKSRPIDVSFVTELSDDSFKPSINKLAVALINKGVFNYERPGLGDNEDSYALGVEAMQSLLKEVFPKITEYYTISTSQLKVVYKDFLDQKKDWNDFNRHLRFLIQGIKDCLRTDTIRMLDKFSSVINIQERELNDLSYMIKLLLDHPNLLNQSEAHLKELDELTIEVTELLPHLEFNVQAAEYRETFAKHGKPDASIKLGDREFPVHTSVVLPEFIEKLNKENATSAGVQALLFGLYCGFDQNLPIFKKANEDLQKITQVLAPDFSEPALFFREALRPRAENTLNSFFEHMEKNYKATDFTIWIDEERFPNHKAVLESISEKVGPNYFTGVLSGQFTEDNNIIFKGASDNYDCPMVGFLIALLYDQLDPALYRTFSQEINKARDYFYKGISEEAMQKAIKSEEHQAVLKGLLQK